MSWFPRCFFQESWDGSSKVGNPVHSFRFFRAKPSTSSEGSSPIRNSKVKSEKINHLDQLKRADVEKWAGRVIYKRGDAYHRSGRVEKPAMTADGALIAWVLGSQKYATLVEVESGDLCSLCTCPYDDSPPCKHAVALLLEYMEAKEQNRPITAASPSDKRIAVIDDLLLTCDLEDEGDDEEAEDEPSVRAPGARGKNRSSELDVNRFLSGLTKEELIGLIGEWSARFPEIADELAHRGRLSAGNTGALAAAIRREIIETTSQDAWYDHWRNEGSIPDYSRLKLRLGDLLDAGAADEVVRLGALLLERGGRQVETSDDEGDTASEIASCMEVVFQALSRTTMPAADRMMWAIDADLKDSFDLCEGSEEFWGRQEYAAADWSVVADNLLKRLGSINHSASKDGFSYDYARNQLADWIIRALENAKRINEIIPLCEREAETTGSYVRLVQRLIDEGREEGCRALVSARHTGHDGPAAGHCTCAADLFAGDTRKERGLARCGGVPHGRISRSPFPGGVSDPGKGGPQGQGASPGAKRGPRLSRDGAAAGGRWGMAATGNGHGGETSSSPAIRTISDGLHAHRYRDCGKEARRGAPLVRFSEGATTSRAYP